MPPLKADRLMARGPSSSVLWMLLAALASAALAALAHALGPYVGTA